MKKIIIVLFILIYFINVNASTSVIAIDVDSGRILYQKNATEKRLIASTTKIMTFIVAYEYANFMLEEEVLAGEEILKMYGTSIYLNYHEKMKLKDLMYGLMLRSGNDAAVVIANYVACSEEKFVELMNKKAMELGMNNTIFKNAHGLDENTKNYSSAYDLSILSKYAYKNKFYRDVVSTKYYDTKTENKAYSWINRNKLLFTYKNCIGSKTGYTPSAGKTFVSLAQNNDLVLSVVSLNDPDIFINHKKIYEELFNKYQNYQIINKNLINKNLKKKGLYIKNDIYYPLTREEYKYINSKINIYDKCLNDTCGNIEIVLNDKVLLKENIYKKNNIIKNKKSLIQKIKDFFKIIV